MKENSPMQADSQSGRALSLGSVSADAIADILFNQDAPVARYIPERDLRRQVTAILTDIYEQVQSGQMSQRGLENTLNKLDRWLAHKLSGANVLTLARFIEQMAPEWVEFLPRTLGSRYEELRVARLWSALLNPEALSRLRTAVAQEREFDNGGLE